MLYTIFTICVRIAFSHGTNKCWPLAVRLLTMHNASNNLITIVAYYNIKHQIKRQNPPIRCWDNRHNQLHEQSSSLFVGV